MKINNDEIIIRSFEINDIDWVIQKHVDLYGKEYGFDDSFKQYVAEPIHKFQDNFDKEKENLWIAVVNGKPEGMIAIVKAEDKTAQLRWFLINPEARGKRLGNKLMSVAIDFCEQKKFESVFLWTISNLETARYLYKKYGFELSETHKHIIWGKELTEERWVWR